MSKSFTAPLTVCQAPLSMRYYSGLPFPSPEDLSDAGIEPVSSALAGRSFTAESPGKPRVLN